MRRFEGAAFVSLPAPPLNFAGRLLLLNSKTVQDTHTNSPATSEAPSLGDAVSRGMRGYSNFALVSLCLFFGLLSSGRRTSHFSQGIFSTRARYQKNKSSSYARIHAQTRLPSCPLALPRPLAYENCSRIHRRRRVTLRWIPRSTTLPTNCNVKHGNDTPCPLFRSTPPSASHSHGSRLWGGAPKTLLDKGDCCRLTTLKYRALTCPLMSIFLLVLLLAKPFVNMTTTRLRLAGRMHSNPTVQQTEL